MVNPLVSMTSPTHTPTPMRHAPLQLVSTHSQHAAATPPVSTPFSISAHATISSLGAKSSPQHLRKSPAAPAQVGLHPPMTAFNFNSPSTSAAMGAIGSLGMDSEFEMSLDGVSVGGLDSRLNRFLDKLTVGAPNDPSTRDGDMIKVLETIIKDLSVSALVMLINLAAVKLTVFQVKQGFVSDAGLWRLAQSLGLEVLSEEQTTPSGRKTTTLAIAGLVIAMEIVLENNIVMRTSLTYHGAASSVSRHMEAANRILLYDLQLRSRQSPLTKTLDSFASNFKRLTVLDKLSLVPGLDCFEALAGIYASLARLHQWDLSKLRQNPTMATESDEFVAGMAMCTRHGLLAMHTRGKIGLALQYWKELHLAPTSSDELADFSREYEKVWSLIFSCAPGGRLRCPPVRVSEDWISARVVKDEGASMNSGPLALEWLEPENISLPQSEDNKDDTMVLLEPELSTTRVPQVMFTITFDPPLILPQNEWRRLYMYANLQAPHVEMPQRDDPDTYDSLLFPIPHGTRRDPGEPRSITSRRLVRLFSPRDGKLHALEHESVLYIYKPIYSRVIKEMPFSHPRQVIDMLPLLRQYAFLSNLLENIFGKKRPGSPSRAGEEPTPSQAKPLEYEARTMTIEDQLTAFMADEPPANEAGMAKEEMIRKLAVTVWVHPSPRLQVVFPFDTATANIILKILEGGTVEIVHDDLLGRGRLRKEVTRQFLCKNLEKLEDLCKWAEWIRVQLLP